MPKEFVAVTTDGAAWSASSGAISVTKFESGDTGVAEVEWGGGRVVLFGIRPQYRGQTFGTFKLLLNAIIMGRAREIR